jgi:hypothetical protein
VRLRVRICDRELEVGGSDEFVDAQFLDFAESLKSHWAALERRRIEINLTNLHSEELYLRSRLKDVQKQLRLGG